jgi:hypothetical protein
MLAGNDRGYEMYRITECRSYQSRRNIDAGDELCMPLKTLLAIPHVVPSCFIFLCQLSGQSDFYFHVDNFLNYQ